MAKDPVCGMTVDEEHALKSIYNGKTFFFCSPSCKQNFEKNPGHFAK